MFDCINVDRQKYLRSDLSIHCDSPAHKSAEAFSVFMILVFPLGLPVLYFGMLWHNRDRLFGKDKSSMSFLRFFLPRVPSALLLLGGDRVHSQVHRDGLR
jgi:hypothetical protein